MTLSEGIAMFASSPLWLTIAALLAAGLLTAAMRSVIHKRRLGNDDAEAGQRIWLGKRPARQRGHVLSLVRRHRRRPYPPEANVPGTSRFRRLLRLSRTVRGPHARVPTHGEERSDPIGYHSRVRPFNDGPTESDEQRDDEHASGDDRRRAGPAGVFGEHSLRTVEQLRGSRRAWLRPEKFGMGEYLLISPSTSVGRAADNDIVLNDVSVSRRHAVLSYSGDGWWLLPDVTGNGTFCNDVLIQPGERVRVGNDDVLRFGLSATLRLTVSEPTPTLDALRFVAAARTTPGARRDNEDAHLATDVLLAVADGVAGRNAGRVAARSAIRQIAVADTDTDLIDTVRTAHQQIVGESRTVSALSGMATTLDAVKLTFAQGRWLLDGIHVGDGYVFIVDSDGVDALTLPDTAGHRLEVNDPERARQLRGDPDYYRIVAALGFAGEFRPARWSRPATVGTRLIVTSDGLLAAASTEDIVDTIHHHRADDPDVLADALLAIASNARDNVTVVVADVDYDNSSPPVGRPTRRGTQRQLPTGRDATTSATGG
jgi:serine/threonine protein phosphatase PrpC